MSANEEPTGDEHVEDLDVPKEESAEVKGGAAASDYLLELDGAKASPRSAGNTKWGDIILKRGSD